MIRGVLIDRAWSPVLSGDLWVTVVSRFEHALNLQYGDQLLTVLGPSTEPAPGCLLTDRSPHPMPPIGAVGAVAGNRLSVGPLRIDLDDCVLVDCTARPVPAHAIALDAAAVRRAAETAGLPGSWDPDADGSPFEQALSDRLDRGTRRLQHALGNGSRSIRPDPLWETVADLVGLGAGLTPSGDDYLLGVLAALWHRPDVDAERRRLAPAIAAHLHSTTSVSRHYLTHGMDGEFHLAVRDAATAVLTGDPDLPATFARVLTIGASSGADTLRGLLDTLLSDAAAPPPPVH